MTINDDGSGHDYTSVPFDIWVTCPWCGNSYKQGTYHYCSARPVGFVYVNIEKPKCYEVKNPCETCEFKGSCRNANKSLKEKEQ